MCAMNPRLLRPTPTGFDPRRIANLAAWYDAGVTSSLTFNGSNVSSWADLSGNGRDATQGTAAQQPSFSLTDANGKPAVTSSLNSLSLVTNAFPVVSTTSVFCVANNTNTAFGGYFQRGATNEIHSGLLSSSPDRFQGRSPQFGASSLAYVSGYTVLQWLFSPSLNRISANGVVGTDGTSTTFPPDSKALRLMGLQANGLGLIGGMAEFLYYERVLSDAEAVAVRRYLGRKFGIATT